tara:strand:+ start:175 stop:1029 length:855 start_codon:yes stop_codon:yes gene_type:complete
MLNFLGIGAPKSATTWLAACMSEHPEIYMPPEKEISFFSSDKEVKGDYSTYLELFKDAKKKQITGEYSVSYLGAADKAASRIYDFNKNLKLIVVLRDPVKRSFSHYKWLKQLGRIDESIDFFTAIKIDYRIISDSLYGENLKTFLKYFPKENFLIINFEDIQINPKLVIKKVFKFLGVDSNFETKISKLIIGKTIKVKYRFLENLRTKVYYFIKNSRYKYLIFILKKIGISNLYRKINNAKDKEKLTEENYLKIRNIFTEDLNILKEQFNDLDYNWSFNSKTFI